jgi:hypothetical protein
MGSYHVTLGVISGTIEVTALLTPLGMTPMRKKDQRTN